MRIWFRDKQAIFWTFFLPVVLISVFGLLDFGAFSTVDLGIVDRANNETSQKLAADVRALDAFDIQTQRPKRKNLKRSWTATATYS